MARKITNIGSGIYFREIDLTTVQATVGQFAGAQIGLTEKGPAFEIIVSANYDERREKLGDLNPLYPSSYFAKQFLEQANNFKDVRLLGLEGYNEEKLNPTDNDIENTIFAILFDVPSSTSATKTATTPLIAGPESIACILKPRKTSFTGRPTIDTVTVDAAPTPTDNLFQITITFTDSSTQTVLCSLRPERTEYIEKVFGTHPRDKAKIAGQTSPLWVEYVFPTTKTRNRAWDPTNPANPDLVLEYRYPDGQPGAGGVLSLIPGDIKATKSFSYPNYTINGVVAGSGTYTFTTTSPHPFTIGMKVEISGVNGFGVVSSGNKPINSVWEVATVGTNSFTIVMTPAEFSAITGSYTTGGIVRQYYSPTWESEVMDLGGTVGKEITYQTPITPWFVSDADASGNVVRLFRFWSISDGESANTDIKLEIFNHNPDGNIGKGSFDLLIRKFNDTDDKKQTLELFTNLTLNPKSDNYIAKRIGDGETYPIKSSYIFVEMNEDIDLPDNALPYGVEGYPNVSGISMPDVQWTTEYNFNQPITKQTLGLANNKVNMFAPITKDHLSFKNVSVYDTTTVGKGFHLNPNNNAMFDPSNLLFTKASQSIYQISATNTLPVTGIEKAKRNRFVVCFYGGFDGWNVYKEREWGDVSSKDFEALTAGLKILSDVESIESDFSVLVTPDLNFEDHLSATLATLEMVERRGDALYLFDFKYDELADPEQAKTTLSFTPGMKSNYSAVYFPYVQIEDQVNKTNIWMPPSLIALGTIASTAVKEDVWQPPAGSLRTVAANLVRTRRRMKGPDREILKSANINPITLFPGTGFEITETRTTQETFSALSFIHNRLLLGYAKKALNQTLRPLLHQLNNNTLQQAFVNVVTPIFERIKKLNGLEDFKVNVKNVEEDRTTLYGEIIIVPLYPVEKIQVDFILSNNGVDFQQ
jgi:hypothetical protein